MASRKLKTYRARRDFERTAEPSGARKVKPSKCLRYVIQKHAARRLHYDLRLELDGVFKSWAVTRGPSLDPADKRLAVEVEDHPLDYGDFEGTIPAGEYGGGAVMIWDRGCWYLEGDEKKLRRGEIKFRLDGERLQGRWVLVRMRTEGKRTNWLLIRHSPEEGESGTDTDKLMAGDTSVASGRTMAQIAAGKGRGPKPFMLAKGKSMAADAVWHSNQAESASERGAGTAKRTASSSRFDATMSRRDTSGSKRDATRSRRTATPARRTRAQRAARTAARSSGSSRRGGSRARLPEFIAPQLATLVSTPPGGEGIGHEAKFDGYRMQMRTQGGAATMRTRKGLDWSAKFDSVVQAAGVLPDSIIDGEVIALNDKGQPDFGALQAALSEGDSSRLIYYVFDLLFDESGDLRSRPLRERKEWLKELLEHAGLDRNSLIRYVDHLETEGRAVLDSACRMGLEGIISKRLDDPYRSGRTSSWVKAKCRGGHEVVIGGYTTTGSSFRSLLIGVNRGRDLVYGGKVGTGFSQEKLRTLMPKLKKLETRDSPFSGPEVPRGTASTHWVKPELVAEIGFAGWTGSGMVRQAAFKGLREDKPAKEVKAEMPAKPEEAEVVKPQPGRRSGKRTGARSGGQAGARSGGRAGARSGARPRAKSTTPLKATTVSKAATQARSITRASKAAVSRSGKGAAASRAQSGAAHPSSGRVYSSAPETTVLGIPVSKPDKALWPDGGDGKPVTKLDLAHYFETIAPWMMPHIEGRPCSVIRAPDGIGGQRFFQRHAMRGSSALLTLTKVEGDRDPYVQIDTPEALIAMAQSATLELHPWNCEPGQPEVPGRLVFDLDPSTELGFDVVIAAALELRERLESLGLVAFCKTTGGKGLHVVTPLEQPRARRLEWPEAKAFAMEVCRQMADDAPQRYVLNMAKKERTGRIFLDYLRNDRMSTAVAPYSPRMREGAPVSMPLEWSQVRKGLDPSRFTIRTAPALARTSKAWEDYCESERELAAAVRKLMERAEKR